MRDNRVKCFMQTVGGMEYFFHNFSAEDVCVNDISHALGNICRFAGHTTEFYSVAQHSVLVSRIVPLDDALWGLMHDAAEAYLGDILWGLKHGYQGFEAEYAELEARVMSEIATKIGLTGDKPESVIEADRIVLSAETRDLYKGGRIRELCYHERESEVPKIGPLLPKMATMAFKLRLIEIGFAGESSDTGDGDHGEA